ncbi:MAG: hypothetical protein WBF17_11370, partial [Phycisphaerae bacterium]
MWKSAIASVLAAAGTVAAAPVVTEFDQPFSYSYLSFEKTTEVSKGVAHITGKDSRGGAGVLRKMDLGAFVGHTLAVWAKVGPQNRAKGINVFFGSGEAKRTFHYSLKDAGREEFTKLLPDPPLALSPTVADEPDQSFDPAKIQLLQVQGDWSSDPVDVYIDKIELIAPTEGMKAARLAHAEKLRQAAERKRREAEQKRKEREKLIAGAPHPADGPRVVHVGAVTPDTLAVVIQAGEIVLRKQVPYEPRKGDEIAAGKDATKVLVWEKGRIVDADKGRYVRRAVKGSGKRQEIGALVVNEGLLAPGPACRGTPLTTATVDKPRAYRIASKGHRAYSQGRHPEKVFVKSKPTGQAAGTMAVRYHLYLKLAEPLKQGATYT